MSAKNNAIIAGSWLFFVMVFGGGLLLLLVIALLISRSADSDNDKKIKVGNTDVVKSMPTTGCGCGKGKHVDKHVEKKTSLIDENSKAISSKEQLILNLRNVYNTSCQQITQYYNGLIQKVNTSKISASNKVIQIRNLRNELNNVISSLTRKLNADIANIRNSVPQVQVQSQTQVQSYKKALLVGINYIGTKYELNGCINDVDSIQSKLQSAYGFNQSNIKKLTDSTLLKPTRQNILNELTNLLQTANTGDILFFFYSGHGTYTTDRNREEKDGRDEMIVPLDFQNIIDDDLKRIIQANLKWGVTLFAMFDSCHSGTVLDLKYQYMENGNNSPVSQNNQLSETSGNVFMISGCADWQTSTDAYIQNKFRGAMTWSFLESVQPNMSWRTLLQNMRSALKTKGFDQVPQISSGKPLNLDSGIVL